MRRRCRRLISACRQGFTLLELVVSASLASLIFVGLVVLLTTTLRLHTASQLRFKVERAQQRALRLIRSDVRQGYGLVANPEATGLWSCPLVNRRPVLAISLSPDDPSALRHAIVYSVGSAPSAIWRGDVLMRCGPAYGLDGRIDPVGVMTNRVLLDSLPSSDGDGLGFAATEDTRLQLVEVTIEQLTTQHSSLNAGSPQRVRSRLSL